MVLLFGTREVRRATDNSAIAHFPDSGHGSDQLSFGARCDKGVMIIGYGYSRLRVRLFGLTGTVKKHRQMALQSAPTAISVATRRSSETSASERQAHNLHRL